MITHLNAIKAKLVGRTVYLVDATGASKYPYVLLTPGPSLLGEVPLADVSGDLDADIRATCVGVSAESALGLAGAVRSTLSPGGAWTQVVVAGRSAWLRWERTEMTAVDRDNPITGTNTYPVITVDSYRLSSQPA